MKTLKKKKKVTETSQYILTFASITNFLQGKLIYLYLLFVCVMASLTTLLDIKKYCLPPYTFDYQMMGALLRRKFHSLK